MSLKRPDGPYSYDDDEDYVPTKSVKYSEREDVLPAKEKKHTLDSDEEDDAEEGTAGGDDNEKNRDVLRDEDIDGQEEGTVGFEGENAITPFNMKEELQEGHFDGDGFYHFKKDSDQVKDAWLEDIDWIKVKQREGDEKKYGSDLESDSESEIYEENADGTIMLYTEMLEFVREGETVAKALKRLGGNKKMSSAQKWKLKKMGSLGKESEDQNMADFLRLTELANKIMETGNMDIYQETYEMINFKVQKASAPPAEPEMDMFADDAKEDNVNSKKDKESKKTESEGTKDSATSIGELMWELRWKNEDTEEIYGPFTSEKMLQWQESGYFQKGAYVRKSKQNGQWYSTKRLDFELYA